MKFRIEFKWALLISIMLLLWKFLENKLGWHSTKISSYSHSKFYILLPFISYFIMALLDKRKNYYLNKMNFSQSFRSGVRISLLLMLFAPLLQVILTLFVSPNYFKQAIHYSIAYRGIGLEEAEAQYNLSYYILKNTFILPLLGILTSALASLFIKRRTLLVE